ncbi:MAG: PDZ domain-containing protein [Deltaproteobacteria bacterium]|nr:PDZ domain-containing protein [Deltaproteobacteria bacterium]
MPRTLRRVATLALLLGAWAIAGSDRVPAWIASGEAVAGPAAALTSEVTRAAEGQRPAHDLSALRTFTKVILYVKDNYVDPKRVKPKEMMVSALDYVEKAVPDVLVDGTAEAGKLSVNVNSNVKVFDISHVDSLWKMSFTLKDVFEHLGKHMRASSDTRDVEYAAVNGMLSTLDPHSVLLRPELYREMKLTTKGEFGGLGFVIQMKEGNLSVVKVLPKTPAYRAGIKKDDHISRIGEESTVNMDLNEAVSKLRGPVDSKVIITVVRDGKAQVLALARAMISIESVQSKLLASGVGYVRLKNFQGNTTRDLRAALEEMSRRVEGGRLKGLVLDLRGNPGGLLDQAIQVSDQFISEGTLVATVGFSDKLREEKKAHADEGDTQYPIAVLVNSGSASASEIVAGALKNLGRAVIIGRQTFGKGSVQVLYDFPDDSALKLTIAKYLTPGDVSIQEVGVTPDIELVPTRVTRERVDVFAPRKSMGEADLEHHFSNPSSKEAAKKRDEVLGREKPLESLKYLKEDQQQADALAQKRKAEEDKAQAKKKGGKGLLRDVDTGGNTEQLDDQMDAESQDEVKEDFEVQFARDFVLKAPQLRRDQMLAAGKPFIVEKRAAEARRVDDAIKALGVDWTAGPSPARAQLDSQLTPASAQATTAGEQMDLELTVINRGVEAVHRLSAWTESDNPYVDRREFLLGRLAPGEKKFWTVPVRLPKDLPSRKDAVTVHFRTEQGDLPETLAHELSFSELPRPMFGFSWQVVDDCKECNGDGRVQRGETVDLVLDVTNRGRGRALDSFAQIKNGGDQNIFIEKGRFKLGALDPGETKQARFTLQLKPGWKAETFPLKLAVLDEPLEEYCTEKLELPVEDKPVQLEPVRGAVKLAEGTQLFRDARGSFAVARVQRASVVNPLQRAGDFLKVDTGEGRAFWVNARAATADARAKVTGLKELAYQLERDPPLIELNGEAGAGALVSDGERLMLSGTVTASRQLMDVYVLVNDQKVLFKAGGAPPAPGKPVQVTFSADVPLKEGNNAVLVVARETGEFSSRKTLFVRRRAGAVAQKAPPAQVPAQP